MLVHSKSSRWQASLTRDCDDVGHTRVVAVVEVHSTSAIIPADVSIHTRGRSVWNDS